MDESRVGRRKKKRRKVKVLVLLLPFQPRSTLPHQKRNGSARTLTWMMLPRSRSTVTTPPVKRTNPTAPLSHPLSPHRLVDLRKLKLPLPPPPARIRSRKSVFPKSTRRISGRAAARMVMVSQRTHRWRSERSAAALVLTVTAPAMMTSTLSEWPRDQRTPFKILLIKVCQGVQGKLL